MRMRRIEERNLSMECVSLPTRLVKNWQNSEITKKDFRKYFRYLKNSSLLFETKLKLESVFYYVVQGRSSKTLEMRLPFLFQAESSCSLEGSHCLKESQDQNLRDWATGSVFTQRWWISFSLGAFSLPSNLRLSWSFGDHNTASNSAGLNWIMNLRSLFW